MRQRHKPSCLKLKDLRVTLPKEMVKNRITSAAFVPQSFRTVTKTDLSQIDTVAAVLAGYAGRRVFHGFNVLPCTSFAVIQRNENAGVLLRPTKTAPATRSFCTCGASTSAMASRKATMPFVVACPASSLFILIEVGTP